GVVAVSSALLFRSSVRAAATSRVLTASSNGDAAETVRPVPSATMTASVVSNVSVLMLMSLLLLEIDASGALTDAVDRHAKICLVHHRQQPVAERCVLLQLDVPVALQTAAHSAHERHRQRIVGVLIAICHAAPVQEH